MMRAAGNLGALWPFREIDAPPGLASIPVESFWDGEMDLPSDAARVTYGAAPGRAPQAAYAMMLRRQRAVGTISRWDPSRATWKKCVRTSVPRGPAARTVLELNHIVLGNIENEEALKKRVGTLLRADLRAVRTVRIIAMLLSVSATLLLFTSIRLGLESRSIEAFLLFFGFSAGGGLIAARLRIVARSLADHALSRVSAQFHYEDSLLHKKATLRPACLTETLREHDRHTEVITVLGGFTILLGFAYFIAPPVVIAAFVAVIIAGLVLGSGAALSDLGKVVEWAEARVGYALLAFHGSSNTTFVPRALRNARRQILRDRTHRFVRVRSRALRGKVIDNLRYDIAWAVSFTMIVGAYFFWFVVRDSGTATAETAAGVAVASIVEIAPIVVLIGLSRSSLKVAQLIRRSPEKQGAARNSS